MNTSLTPIRKFTIIVLTVYFGTIALISIGLALSGKWVWDNFGSTVLYIGTAIFILAFLSMGATLKGDGVARSPHMRNIARFKEWRKQERPIEFVTWAIIVAAALIAGTGYLVLVLINSGSLSG